jgi:endonuclease YncB( thermonuclease family)
MFIRVAFIFAAFLVLVAAAVLRGDGREAPRAEAGVTVPPTDSCVIKRVIDGDTFECEGGPTVRMLQIDAPEKGKCGGGWATAALANIFLPVGRRVRLTYDAVRLDPYGRTLAAPIATGTDGGEYNISIIMVYVGLAKAAYYGDNARLLDWALAAETWARNAQWNMWAPGGPFNGGTRCNDPIQG